MLYKLVMKVNANRFKAILPKLISQEQAGFIVGRNISDNIFLAQEVIHSIKSKRKWKNWMVVKLDLEKAYDRVSIYLVKCGWNSYFSIASDYVRHILLYYADPLEWYAYFKSVRGIRQGCPLSPYLFVLYMEWLGHIIWAGIDYAWDGPAVSHLFFADDLVIFCKAHLDQAQLLDDILNKFRETLGHRISVRKSNVFFSKVTTGEVRNQINQMFRFQEVQNLGRYLGVPLLHKRVTKNTLSFLVDKLLMIPKGVCLEIEKVVRHFIWGRTDGNPKMSLIGWDSICQPRT
ncbi:LINE-1 reverse transcriptase isogeny [Gossypium australe]|uniref:LINE-1 reverse transcriptase isogeny n=1 Tax=Gossypium australe TaxID=47621 RepID=A0A5B6WXY0_9ROSI|nr:LINE-1 reverse transcriptase isogeny [Gossypium australe]